jgi:transmembrane sensor
MNTLREKSELSIAEQAAQWLCELGDESQDRRAEFVAWLQESPRHVEEFLLTTTVWKAFDGAGPGHDERTRKMIAEALLEDGSASVVALDRGALPSGDIKLPARVGARRISQWVVGIAATLAVLAIVLRFLPLGAQTYATGIGEQRTFRLPDSSIVYLNAQSRVKVRFSKHARELHLLEGEGLFTVARDRARPFRVKAGGNVIQALGTQFNVYRRAEVTTVSVLEGAVQILTTENAATSSQASQLIPSSSPANRLAAGEQASITSGGRIVRPAKTDVTDAVAWRDRRVVFRAERLEDITAEFSRYNPRHIRVEGDLARNKRLTASFAADDPESLVLFLAKEQELVVEREGDGFLVRGRD